LYSIDFYAWKCDLSSMATPQMLTANRLVDGDVVYWRAGGWVEAFADGDVFSAEADAEAALDAAREFVADNVMVNPYLFDVSAEADGARPVTEREIIRAAGPTTRSDLGKQAHKITSPSWGGRRIEPSEDASGGGPTSTLPPTRLAFARRPPHQGEVNISTIGDDDVSI